MGCRRLPAPVQNRTVSGHPFLTEGDAACKVGNPPEHVHEVSFNRNLNSTQHMNEMNPPNDLPAVGVDIAKAKFDACLWQTKPWLKTFDNTPEGCAALLAWLTQHGVTQAHVCLEATSTYGDALARFCHERGHRVSLVNPACIKAFGQACGLRNKTDSADARLIAEFCAKQRPRLWTPPAPEVATLRELLRHWTDLSAWLAAQKCRLETAGQRVRGFIKRELEFLEEQIREVRRAVNAHLRKHPELWKKVKLLETIPGIGRQNAARLLAELPPELETAREAAAYVGVTPRRNESGAIVRRSCLSRQGKASVRPGLYLAALNARFQLGFADRTLGLRLPMKNRNEGETLRTRLAQVGLWRESGHEHFNGCITCRSTTSAATSSAFTGGGCRARRRRGASSNICIRPDRIAACSTGSACSHLAKNSSCARRCSTR